MAVQINEVVVRAIITGSENTQKQSAAPGATSENISSVSKEELLELIDEVIKDKKER